MSAQTNENSTESATVPPELVDLVRFVAAHYVDVHEYIYRNCPPDVAAQVPKLQSTQAVFAANVIGKQNYSAKNLKAAVDWMLDNPDFGSN